jgi:hypothetical protein
MPKSRCLPLYPQLRVRLTSRPLRTNHQPNKHYLTPKRRQLHTQAKQPIAPHLQPAAHHPPAHQALSPTHHKQQPQAAPQRPIDAAMGSKVRGRHGKRNTQEPADTTASNTDETLAPGLGRMCATSTGAASAHPPTHLASGVMQASGPAVHSLVFANAPAPHAVCPLHEVDELEVLHVHVAVRQPELRAGLVLGKLSEPLLLSDRRTLACKGPTQQ